MRSILQLRRQNIWLLVSLAMVAWVRPAPVWATSKPHVITFGKWITVQWIPSFAGISAEDKPSPTPSLALKVRPLLVDARVKEFTLGQAHDVTDRLFVVRRAFRVNDSLPQESATPPHWQWQRGGWLLVDRVTGRISPINLPEFDAVYSDVTWYRDYAAYCGVSDDSKQTYAMVVQINRRKPIVKWLIREAKLAADAQQVEIPDPPCRLPDWQRSPARVTFKANPSTKRTYVIRGHSVDLSTAEEDEEEAAK
ncbi:MAG: hypothetical protein WAN65_18600 [Candidatus Sulfotelmatobacter sp.]